MKRLIPLFLSLVLLLTACGQGAANTPTPLTETDVEMAYFAAEEVYGWFNLASLPAAGDAVETDGGFYRAVDYEGLATYADLEARVRALFAPELAEQILADSVNYRDIGGRLHTAEGARGANLYLKERAFTVEPVSDALWTVTVTFFADSWEFERPSVTIGYSQRVLHYEQTADGWRFTDICPSDDLDLDAETVFTFTYDDEMIVSAEYLDYADLPLALYTLHADGAFAEGANDRLMRRFWERPEDILTLAEQLHIEWKRDVFSGIGYAAAAWLTPEEQPAFAAVLDACAPETPAAQAALKQVRDAYQDGVSMG